MTRSISGPRRASTARSSSRASASSAAAVTAGGCEADASSTISVSTGTSESSLTALGFLCQVVVGDLIAALEVEAIAAAPGLARGVFGSDHLEQALEALEVRRAFGAQVEQQLAAGWGLGVRGDEDRRVRRERVVRRAVRHEAYGGPGPQQPVDAARGLGL